MPELRLLAAHDPLPDGRAVVLMRRLEEDAPDAVMTELIVLNPGHANETARLQHPTGAPLSLAEALPIALARAEAEALPVVWQVDRTSGALEQAALRRHGDRSFSGTNLADSDLEHGEPGADMRDNHFQGAPRRF